MEDHGSGTSPRTLAIAPQACFEAPIGLIKRTVPKPKERQRQEREAGAKVAISRRPGGAGVDGFAAVARQDSATTDPSLSVSLFIITGCPFWPARTEQGYTDGQGEQGRFNCPTGLAVADISLMVVDYWNERLRWVSMDGTVSTVAGSIRLCVKQIFGW